MKLFVTDAEDAGKPVYASDMVYGSEYSNEQVFNFVLENEAFNFTADSRAAIVNFDSMTVEFFEVKPHVDFIPISR